MRLHDALVGGLAAERVTTVFGVLSGGLEPVVNGLVASGIRFVAARHESAAVGMADGWSRATGGLGVAAVGGGPALANTVGTLRSAALARSKVLLLTGTPRSTAWAQNLEAAAVAQLVGARFAQLGTDGPALASTLHRAIRAALCEGPCIGAYPIDHGRDQVGEFTYHPAWQALPRPQRPVPDQARVETVAELIRASRRTVVLAGRGAVASGAGPSLIALATRTRSVLSTTLLARDMFAGHPYDAGICGGFATRTSRTIFEAAELVIAFGASLNEFTLDRGRIFERASLVQVDVDSRATGMVRTPDETMIGDARATAGALAAAVGEVDGWADEAMVARLAAADAWADDVAAPTAPRQAPAELDPRLVVRVCDNLLPVDKNLVIGIGHFQGRPAAHVRVADPSGLILPWEGGAAGCGLPVAIGAAIAVPGRRTVLFEGDGGLMFSLTDIDTAVREGARLTVVCIDDGGFGADRYQTFKRGEPDHGSRYPNPDFAQLARVAGWRSFTADTEQALRAALTDAATVDAPPTFVHVRVDPNAWDDTLWRAVEH